jgi:hypothetical protein
MATVQPHTVSDYVFRHPEDIVLVREESKVAKLPRCRRRQVSTPPNPCKRGSRLT